MPIETILTGLLIPATAEPAACQPDRMLHTGILDSPVVVLGSLVEPSDGDQATLPTLGGSDYARLLVKVHIQRLVRGDFPAAIGSDVRLAVHSVALTFGYDHSGETYYLGFEKGNGPESNLTLADIGVPEQALFFVYATLTERSRTESAGLPRVDLVAQPASVLTAVLEPGRLPPELAAKQPVLLGMPALDPPIRTPARVCLGLIHRGEGARRPLRLVRFIRNFHELTEE
jgi:hypothetical protein